MPDSTDYRSAPAWLRSRLLKKISDALVHHTPQALVGYCAKFAADPAFGDYEHLRRFDDVLRKLAADVADGTACPGCGRDPRHPFCTGHHTGMDITEHAHEDDSGFTAKAGLEGSPIGCRRPPGPWPR